MGIGNFTITNKNGAPLSAGFYPGQKIEGLVNLTVSGEHMKCKGIRLDIDGKGRVQGGNSIGFFGLKNGPNIGPKTGPRCHVERIYA